MKIRVKAGNCPNLQMCLGTQLLSLRILFNWCVSAPLHSCGEMPALSQWGRDTSDIRQHPPGAPWCPGRPAVSPCGMLPATAEAQTLAHPSRAFWTLGWREMSPVTTEIQRMEIECELLLHLAFLILIKVQKANVKAKLMLIARHSFQHLSAPPVTVPVVPSILDSAHWYFWPLVYPFSQRATNCMKETFNYKLCDKNSRIMSNKNC